MSTQVILGWSPLTSSHSESGIYTRNSVVGVGGCDNCFHDRRSDGVTLMNFSPFMFRGDQLCEESAIHRESELKAGSDELASYQCKHNFCQNSTCLRDCKSWTTSPLSQGTSPTGRAQVIPSATGEKKGRSRGKASWKGHQEAHLWDVFLTITHNFHKTLGVRMWCI